MKIIPEFERQIKFSEKTQYKNKGPMLTGRQIMFQLFLFSSIRQGHTMNLSDLLNVELYNGFFKMNIQALEETFWLLVMLWMNMSWGTCLSDK